MNNTSNKLIFTTSQKKALSRLKRFIDDDSLNVFILRGYAGTGKTTLVKELIRILKTKQKEFHLLASTGRAAKILSDIVRHDATTVHSHIYSFSDFNQDIGEIIDVRKKNPSVDSTGQLILVFETSTIEHDADYETIYYIIDESSMISDVKSKCNQASFGSDKLLTDLFNHDTRGKFIFVGDECQLPPVGQTKSPALEADYLRSVFNLKVDGAELRDIVRQKEGNDVIVAASKIRDLALSSMKLLNPWFQTSQWTKFPLKGYQNIHIVENLQQLYKMYVDDIAQNGYNESTFICPSNSLCNSTAILIRSMTGIHSPHISVHDLLLVTQNNPITGLKNGDQVEILEILTRKQCAGLTFVMVKVKEILTGKTFTELMIEEIIYTNQTNISQEQQKELFIDYALRMKRKGVKPKTPVFYEGLYKDPYLNALRCVYGYALTCHKAQGGEWKRVYIDIPLSLSAPNKSKLSVYQWLYTALTRAKHDIYVASNMNFV